MVKPIGRPGSLTKERVHRKATLAVSFGTKLICMVCVVTYIFSIVAQAR